MQPWKLGPHSLVVAPLNSRWGPYSLPAPLAPSPLSRPTVACGRRRSHPKKNKGEQRHRHGNARKACSHALQLDATTATSTATATGDKQRNGMKGGTCVHAVCFFISSYLSLWACRKQISIYGTTVHKLFVSSLHHALANPTLTDGRHTYNTHDAMQYNNSQADCSDGCPHAYTHACTLACTAHMRRNRDTHTPG